MSEGAIGIIAFWIFILLILLIFKNWDQGNSESSAETVSLLKRLVELEEKRQANERTPQRVPAPMLDAEAKKRDRT